jgi:hypothetical protein
MRVLQAKARLAAPIQKEVLKPYAFLLHDLGRLGAEDLRRDAPGRHREATASGHLSERLLCLLDLLQGHLNQLLELHELCGDDLQQLLNLLLLEIFELLQCLQLLRDDLQELSDLLQRLLSV